MVRLQDLTRSKHDDSYVPFTDVTPPVMQVQLPQNGIVSQVGLSLNFSKLNVSAFDFIDGPLSASITSDVNISRL